MQTGKLYGVGIGPGDPELLTLKAVRLIKECDVLAFPETAGEKTVALGIAKQAVDLKEKKILPLPMPMTRDLERAEQYRDAAANLVIDQLREGKKVAFLTLGDPSIYSTYLYTHKRVLAQGLDAEIIPGVPSFCAVAAKLNVGLVEGKEPLVVIPASYEGTEELINLKGTKVLMKNGKAIPKIKEQLKTKGLYAHAQMVQNCGLSDERIFTDLDEVDDDAHYFSVIIIK